jgi:phosphoenolpyruvate-protein kinase (PTS system EI component)
MIRPARPVEAPAREFAFLSIGTNDLTQYVMAADRLNAHLAELCQPLQPAVLRALAAIAGQAARLGRHAGVCGEMAGDPRQALLLVGLGIGELSMAPASISAVK